MIIEFSLSTFENIYRAFISSKYNGKKIINVKLINLWFRKTSSSANQHNSNTSNSIPLTTLIKLIMSNWKFYLFYDQDLSK